MASVVLEKVYKSFPQRGKTPITSSLSTPVLTLPDALVTADEPSESHNEAKQRVDVLRNINLAVNEGEFMVLVGPSGCGKSTLLRLIAGLEEATAGNIWIGDRLVNDLPPKARDIAMVFQNYALYPHLNAYDNIAFGLRRMSSESIERENRFPAWLERALVGMTRKLPEKTRYLSASEKAIHKEVVRVCEMLQINNDLLERRPKDLSGGESQRVALGRAIARNPQVFLMDEPLSNLDKNLRDETRAEILHLHRKLGITTIYVTHDQTEAMTMGDRIAVLQKGQMQQLAPPLEIYNRPLNRFVAKFMGSAPMNFLRVKLESTLLITHPQFRLTLPSAWDVSLQRYQGREIVLGIRPEHLTPSPAAPKNLPVQVNLVEALGHATSISADLLGEKDTTLRVHLSPDYSVDIGDKLWLSMDLSKIHLFDPETNEAIMTYPPLNRGTSPDI